MTAIEINNLSYFYNDDKILENINLNVEKKDFLAIIGPNGGGKTTLLKLILNILKLQNGSIKIFNKKHTSKLSNIGYVPQNTNINKDFPIKAIDVVLMGNLTNKKCLYNKKDEQKENVIKVLKQVSMTEHINTKISSLSGGQRQRIMIARALYSNPSILLLDEPTSNIDAIRQKHIYNLLKELNKTITIIVVSHDISVILGYATKVAHINKTLTFHDIKSKTNFDINNEHFCEVELLQMLNKSYLGKSDD